MATGKWVLKNAWKAKRQGQVWIVETQDGTRGYFKFTTPKQWYFSGPMVANEYISAALAKRLGFPVGDLETATVLGPDGAKQRGIVSIAITANEVITWREAGEQVYENPEQYVKDIDLLAMMVVFDAWIANIDRAPGKNLILYRNSPSEKYSWYLIDHGHCLHGSPRKWAYAAWDAPIWHRIIAFYHTPKGLLQLQNSWSALKPMVEKIERLTEADIDAALKSVPSGYLKQPERAFIRRMLLHRQKRLRKMVLRWLNTKGFKEYGSDHHLKKK